MLKLIRVHFVYINTLQVLPASQVCDVAIKE